MSQDDKVARLCEVTQEAPDVCRAILESVNWDLDLAVANMVQMSPVRVNPPAAAGGVGSFGGDPDLWPGGTRGRVPVTHSPPQPRRDPVHPFVDPSAGMFAEPDLGDTDPMGDDFDTDPVAGGFGDGFRAGPMGGGFGTGGLGTGDRFGARGGFGSGGGGGLGTAGTAGALGLEGMLSQLQQMMHAPHGGLQRQPLRPVPDEDEALQQAIRASLSEPTSAEPPRRTVANTNDRDDDDAELQRVLQESMAAVSGASSAHRSTTPSPPAAAASAGDDELFYDDDPELREALRLSTQQAQPQQQGQPRRAADELDLQITFKADVVHVLVPLQSTLGDAILRVAQRLRLKPDGLELIGWPGAAPARPSTELTKLVPPSDRSDPIALLLVTGDLPSPRTTSPMDMDLDSNDEEDEIDLHTTPASTSPAAAATFSAARHLKPLISSGTADPAVFAAAFEERYGPLRPLFFAGDLAAALEEAARACKPLLVYLHDDRSVETQVFCDQVLTNEAVVNRITDHYIVWGWDTTTPGGQGRLNVMSADASNVLADLPNRRPLLIVFVRASGETRRTKTWQGFIYAEELASELVTEAFSCERQFEETRRAQRAAEERQRELDRQNEAYEASLRADRLKEEERKAQEEQQRREQEEAAAQVQREEEHRARLKRMVPSEPAASVPADQVSTFQIRFPDGKRLTRRFNLTDTVEILGMFVESQGFPPQQYRLMMTHPRRVINVNDPRTLEQAGLTGKQVVIVDERVDGDDEGDA